MQDRENLPTQKIPWNSDLKTISLCKRKEKCRVVQRAAVTSGLLWGENLSNPACGPLRPQWPRVLHSFLSLAQRTPFTSWLLSVPADACRISFQTCFQVLVSHVRSVGFYETKSAFVKCATSKCRWSHHDTCLSTRFAFGVMVGVLVYCCCCLFVILKVNCTFEKLIGWLNIFVLFCFFFFLLSHLHLEEIWTSWKTFLFQF